MDDSQPVQGPFSALRYLHQNENLDDVQPSETRRYLGEHFRLHGVPAQWREYVQKLCWGRIVPSEVHPVTSPSVRLYLCSGNDMVTEREIVHKELAPLLEQYCQSAHGVEFQIVDIRKGSPQHLLDEPWTRDICQAEMESCMRTGAGPSIAMVLGMKYGRQVLPSTIPEDTFISVRSALGQTGHDVNLLDTWYLRNTNTSTTVYNLQRNVLIRGVSSSWQDYYEELIELLNDGADCAVRIGVLTEDEATELTASLIGAEVWNGVQCAHPEEKCLGYIRFLTDRNKDMASPEAMQFVDGDPVTCQIDRVPFQAISQLCAEVIPEALGDTTNLKTASVSWKTMANHNGSKDLKEYSASVSRYLYDTARRLIDLACAKHKDSFQHALVREIGDQWFVAGEVSEATQIREDIAQIIQGYLVVPETDQPLVLYGPIGIGKTVIMAQIARFVQSSAAGLFPNLQSATVVRFCDSLTGTPSLRNLLFGICHQIFAIMGRQASEIPEDCEQLKSLFISLITKAEFGGILVILLDGLDRIYPADAAHLFEWIPNKIANNVKLILTVTQEAQDLLTKLSRKIEPDNFVQINRLSSEACVDIVKAWISRSGHTLTPSQWKSVRHACQNCDTPVYLRLIFNQAISWTSYDILQSGDLPCSTQSAVDQLFSELHLTHGTVLCGKVFGYLASVDGGLSQKELLDIASLDSELVNHLNSKHRSNSKELPVWYLYNLFHDVRHVLKPVPVNGTSVLRWTERALHMASVDRYTRKTSANHTLNSVLAEYYLHQWRGESMLPSVCDNILEIRDGSDTKSKVSTETITLLPDSPRKFNPRVSRILPKCLAAAEKYELLKSEILCNFDWIRAKLLDAPITDLFMDYRCYVKDKESQIVLGALQMASRALALDMNLLGVELTGRLLPYASKYKHIRQLIRQCDLAAQRFNPCVPNLQLYSSPGGPLFSECQLKTTAYSDVFWFQSTDGLLMAVPHPTTDSVQLWNLSLQRPVRGVSLPTGGLYPTSRGEKICVISEGNTLSVHEKDTGAEQWRKAGDKAIAGFVVGQHYIAFTTKKGTGPTVLDVANGETVHRLYHHCRSLAISSDDEFLLCASETSLYLYTLPLLERKLTIETSEISVRLKFFTNARKFLALSNSGRLCLYTFDPVLRSFSAVRLVRDFEILEFLFNKTENLVLVRSSHCLRVCDVMSGDLVHTLNTLPESVYLDRSSAFTGAAFTPDSQLVVASRYTYLCAWSAVTGQPLRILLSTSSPIERLFAGNDTALAACLQNDGLMKVWNLENLEEQTKLTNCASEAGIRCLAMSCQTQIALCCGIGECEAKLVDICTGEIKGTLPHREGSAIDDLILSPNGRYAVTMSLQTDSVYGWDDQDPASLEGMCLKEAIVWDTESTRKLHHALNVRFSIFSQDSTIVSFVTTTSYDETLSTYSAVTLDLEQGDEQYNELCSCPGFVCKPFLLQILPDNNSDDLGSEGSTLLMGVVQTSSPNTAERCEFVSRILVRNLDDGDDTDVSLLRIQNLWSESHFSDQIVNATPLAGGEVLIVYSKDVYDFQPSQSLPPTLPRGVNASAFIYDFQTENVTRHFPKFLSPECTIDQTIFSQNCTFAMGSNLEVFNLSTGDKHSEVCDIDHQLCDFALDGRYICAVAQNRREVLVIRSCDGVLKGRLLVHGQGTSLCVGEDGRTVAVGCDDGRLLIFSLTLELSDPVKELVGKLTSRLPLVKTDGLLEKDIVRISSASSHLRRLSARLDQTRLTQRQRPPSYKLLATSVQVTRNLNRLRGSQACCIQ